MLDSAHENNHRSDPIISVIVPVVADRPELGQIRNAVASGTVPSELILVVPTSSQFAPLGGQGENEKVVSSAKGGRGASFVSGIVSAKGEVALLLHSDTLLPEGWDRAIIRALDNRGVVGGAFSRDFDDPSVFFKVVSVVGWLLAHTVHEVWGDRAIFVRTELLRRWTADLDIPLFEDVVLSEHMRSAGRIVFLKERVTTSADAFRRNGKLGHFWRIIRSRAWYSFGGDPQLICSYYYSPPGPRR